MTDRLPVVGKRYKHKGDRDLLEVSFIETREGEHPKVWFTRGTWLYLSQMNDYQELPDSNQQKTYSEEKSKVDEALEELNSFLRDRIRQSNNVVVLSMAYVSLADAAQNLVDALEAEKKSDISKSEPKIDMKEEYVEPINIMDEALASLKNRRHYNKGWDDGFNCAFEQMQKDIQELKLKK